MKIGGVFLRRGLQFARRIAQHLVLDVLHILRDGFAAKSVGAIHLRQDFGSGRLAQIPAEIRRHFEDQRDIVRLQALQRVLGGADRRHLPEIARRSGELFEIGPALGRLVEIESRVADMFDVGGDAETEDEHQQRRADESEGEAHRIAQDLHGFIGAIGEQPAEAQRKARARRVRRGFDGRGGGGRLLA